jgi:hypothetical protein
MPSPPRDEAALKDLILAAVALSLKGKSKPKPRRASSKRAASFIAGSGHISSHRGRASAPASYAKQFGVEAPSWPPKGARSWSRRRLPCLWNVHMAVKRESCRRNRRAQSTIACDRSAPVRAPGKAASRGQRPGLRLRPAAEEPAPGADDEGDRRNGHVVDHVLIEPLPYRDPTPRPEGRGFASSAM